jgi:mRNA interferase YafQ
MKLVRFSGQFKKDFKKYRNDKPKVERLLELIRMLETEIELPEKYKLHRLIGEYKGCWECHIEGDYLLIWMDESAQIIRLLRLGRHSELF